MPTGRPEQLAGLAPGLDPSAQFACRLAERHCQVVVPVLIDRQDTWSGNPAIRMTNQPHREYLYRMAFELGRHIIGYEVQKVLALVDYFIGPAARNALPVGVYGYGEGGLLALYSGALDERISAVGVSGHFRNRQHTWQEPIYRDVWRLLRLADGDRGFGDADLAAMIAPRALIVEAVPGPVVAGPPDRRDGRQGAAPGRWRQRPRRRYARKWRGHARPMNAWMPVIGWSLVEGATDAPPGTPARSTPSKRLTVTTGAPPPATDAAGGMPATTADALPADTVQPFGPLARLACPIRKRASSASSTSCAGSARTYSSIRPVNAIYLVRR